MVEMRVSTHLYHNSCARGAGHATPSVAACQGPSSRRLPASRDRAGFSQSAPVLLCGKVWQSVDGVRRMEGPEGSGTEQGTPCPVAREGD